MRTILCLFIVSCFVSVSSAQSIVVEDTHLSFSSSGETGGPFANSYGAIVCQDLSCDETLIWFEYSVGTLEAMTWIIDEQSDWYVVEFGERFSTASIAANEHPVIFTSDSPRGPVSVGGTDFYLGVTTGVGFRPNPDLPSLLPNRDVFGWVHLRDNAGALEFVSSAMVYGTDDIIVGRTTTVPEPASGTGILLLSVVAAFSRTRRIL